MKQAYENQRGGEESADDKSEPEDNIQERKE